MAQPHNNRANLSQGSIDGLELIYKIASLYSHCLGEIRIPLKTSDDEKLKSIMLPYMVVMYGKIITAYRLLNGYSLDDLHPEIQDITNDSVSLYDIIRSMYECFLQANFNISRARTPKDLRYMIYWWDYRGLSERVQLASTGDFDINDIDEEVKHIDRIANEVIKNHSDQLEEDIINFRKSKNQKLANWPKPVKLYEAAGIHKTQHDYLYKLNSIYTHCEPFAMMQVRYFIETNNNDLNRNILIHGRYIADLSLAAIDGFSRVFPEVKESIDSSPGLDLMIVKGKGYLAMSRASIARN
ncbi:hypothetical protein [Pedobacter sp. Leaf170]|uniref:hypothetical protein n=1 Tax=Pedobacter sp. Leaf170 TaxID=2876558 RepID=UPI001E29044B|nr:hypothetical protein [Pedobacter sp. Leaf170]